MTTLLITTPAHSRLPPWQHIMLAAVLLCASIFLAMTTYLQPGATLVPGLDSSWAYALNYIFQHKLVLGRDIFFTFGPLGFLEHTRALNHELIYISSAFWLAVSITLNIVLLALCYQPSQSRWLFAINICVAIALIFLTNTNTQRLLLLMYAGVYLHWRSTNSVYLALLSLTAALCLLIKFSYGAVALALYIPYISLYFLHNKKISTPLIALVSLAVFYLSIWHFIYGSLTGVGGYIQGGLQFSQGSASAMAINPDNNRVAIGLFFFSFLICLYLTAKDYRRGFIAMPLCFLGAAFIWSKYAFGREDAGHLSYLILFIFNAGLVWIIASRSICNKLTIALAMLLCFFMWRDMHSPQTGAAEFSSHTVYFPTGTFIHRWKPDGLVDLLQQFSTKELEPLKIPADMRAKIGGSSIDIYPWEALIAEANKLNWTPRPIFQNYITYTPFLDAENQKFLDGPNAPEFFIWHYHSFAEIGTRLPFSTDPLTLNSILRHYSMIDCSELFCLWQKTENLQLQETSRSTELSGHWDEWINIPDSNSDIVLAHLNAQRTLPGKLNMAAWKEGGIDIDYRLINGSLKTHELVLDNAASGIWISPYIDRFGTGSKPKVVDPEKLATLLNSQPAEGYIEKAESIFNDLHIYGWGLLPFRHSHSQHLSILLHNAENAYEFKAENRPRPGITAHFGKTGIVDLDSCGFDIKIPTQDIVPGNYAVRFIVRNEGEKAISTNQGLQVTVTPTENKNNVAAIRFRTTRPWAFYPELSVNWSYHSFTGEKPW